MYIKIYKKGVRVGRLLKTDASVSIMNSTPRTADFSNVYSLLFDNNKYFLTIVRDKKRGPVHIFTRMITRIIMENGFGIRALVF